MALTKKARRWLLNVALTLCLTSVCQAHDTRITGLKLIWDKDKLTVSVVTHGSKLGAGDPDAAVRCRLKLQLDGKTFVPLKATVMRDRANDVVMWQAQHQGAVSSIMVLARLYPEDATSRLIVTVFKDGRIFRESLLDATHPTTRISASGATGEAKRATSGAVASRFFPTGLQGMIIGVCLTIATLSAGWFVTRLLNPA